MTWVRHPWSSSKTKDDPSIIYSFFIFLTKKKKKKGEIYNVRARLMTFRNNNNNKSSLLIKSARLARGDDKRCQTEAATAGPGETVWQFRILTQRAKKIIIWLHRRHCAYAIQPRARRISTRWIPPENTTTITSLLRARRFSRSANLISVRVSLPTGFRCLLPPASDDISDIISGLYIECQIPLVYL